VTKVSFDCRSSRGRNNVKCAFRMLILKFRTGPIFWNEKRVFFGGGFQAACVLNNFILIGGRQVFQSYERESF